MLKRKNLSLKENKDILIIYDNFLNCSQREAALKLVISQSALCNLLKNRDNVSSEIVANENFSRKLKPGGKAEDIEEALLE